MVVRFTPDSGHSLARGGCLLRANSDQAIGTKGKTAELVGASNFHETRAVCVARGPLA